MLIGIYGNELTFARPGLSFDFFTCLVGQARGDFAVNVKVDFAGDDKSHSGGIEATLELTYDSQEKGQWIDFLLPIKAKPMVFKGSGKLVVKVKAVTEKAWKTVAQRKIIVMEPSIEHGQPSWQSPSAS